MDVVILIYTNKFINRKYIFAKNYWDKTMADKLMNIQNDDTQNYPLYRLQLVDESYGNSTYITNQSKFQ